MILFTYVSTAIIINRMESWVSPESPASVTILCIFCLSTACSAFNGLSLRGAPLGGTGFLATCLVRAVGLGTGGTRGSDDDEERDADGAEGALLFFFLVSFLLEVVDD